MVDNLRQSNIFANSPWPQEHIAKTTRPCSPLCPDDSLEMSLYWPPPLPSPPQNPVNWQCAAITCPTRQRCQFMVPSCCQVRTDNTYRGASIAPLHNMWSLPAVTFNNIKKTYQARVEVVQLTTAPARHYTVVFVCAPLNTNARFECAGARNHRATSTLRHSATMHNN